MKKYPYGGLTEEEIQEFATNWCKNVMANVRYVLKKNNINQGKYLSKKMGIEEHYFCKLDDRKIAERLDLKFLVSLCKEFGYSADVMLNMDLSKIEESEKTRRVASFLIKLRDDTMNGNIRWVKRVHMVSDIPLSKVMNKKI